MTEIHCPACSALLNLSLADSGSDKHHFSEPQQPVIESKARIEARRLAQYNADLASALREFLAVFPWEGHRLSADIQEGFVSWLRGAPEDRGFGKFLYPVPVTKNRVSKLLVSEIGATFIKGSKGREYRLPQSLQPAGGDGPGAVAGAELAGEGSLKLEGVSSLPLAAHVAAVKAQAVAEDLAARNSVAVRREPDLPVPGPLPAPLTPVSVPMPDGAVIDDELRAKAAAVDYMFVTRDGVRHKVPLKSRGDVASLVKEEAMQEPADYSLPANLVLDGPSVIPVEAGPAPAEASGSCVVYLTDAESDYVPEELEQVVMARLPGRLVLAGAPVLRFNGDGFPYAWCPVHTVDGQPAGDSVVPLPSSDVAFVEMYPSREAVAEAAAAPLPSSQELAAVAGHEALERARTAAAPAAPVFLAPEDLDSYEGADPGDWG